MIIKRRLPIIEVLNYNIEHRYIIKNYSGIKQMKELKNLLSKYERLS